MCTDFKMLKVKVPIVYSGAKGFPLRRDRRSKAITEVDILDHEEEITIKDIDGSTLDTEEEEEEVDDIQRLTELLIKWSARSDTDLESWQTANKLRVIYG